jgi:hypothetical protein
VLVVLVVPQVLGHVPQHLLHAPEVLVEGDRDVQDGAGPVLALVADPEDLAVADVPHRALDVPQPGHPQAHRLDGPDGLPEVHHVADAVLVLEDHEDAGQEVLDEALGAEPQRHARDPGARDQRPDGIADLRDRHDGRHREDDDRGHALEQGPHRLGPLHPPAADQQRRLVVGELSPSTQQRAAHPPGRAPHQLVDEAVQEPPGGDRQQHQSQDRQGLGDQPRDHLPLPVLAQPPAHQVVPTVTHRAGRGQARDTGEGGHGGDVTRRPGCGQNRFDTLCA